MNKHTAAVAAPGAVPAVVRIVVCAASALADPAHPPPNWLDTAAHARGTMALRWVRLGGADPPSPRCSVRKAAAL